MKEGRAGGRGGGMEAIIGPRMTFRPQGVMTGIRTRARRLEVVIAFLIGVL